MRLPALLGLLALTTLVGCATPAIDPPAAPQSPIRMPLPRYVTDDRAAVIGGAAWRARHRAHALGLDGQRCGLTHRGAVRCRRPGLDATPPSRPTPTG